MEYTIYKICCKNENIKDCYIGSTKDLSNRIIQHKSSCNNSSQRNSHCNIYQFIRNNGGFDNFNFEIVETLICKDKNEAFKQELFWINKVHSTLNSRSSYERIDKHHAKTWREKVGKKDCECGAIVSAGNYTRHLKTSKHLTYLSCHQEQDEGHISLEVV
jgi:group I intron endonuclease